MRRTFLLCLWILTDAILYISAYVIAYILRVGFILSTNFPLDLYLQTVTLVTPAWLCILMEMGVFRLLRVQSDTRNILYLLFSAVMGSALFTLAYYFLHDRFFSRLLLIEAGVLSFFLPLIWHLAFDQWQRRILRKDPAAYPVLIIGTNRDAEGLIRRLNDRQSPLKPIGVMDANGSSKKEIAGVPFLGKFNVLEATIKKLKPAYLVQCSNLEHTMNLLSLCRNEGITYMLMPSVLGVMGSSEEFVNLEGVSLVQVHERRHR